jgi:hypothetical protein
MVVFSKVIIMAVISIVYMIHTHGVAFLSRSLPRLMGSKDENQNSLVGLPLPNPHNSVIHPLSPTNYNAVSLT